MARFRICVAVARVSLVACLLLFICAVAHAQISTVTEDTSTPIEGAGHDYIHLLSETVNPANGSVSLRIQVPIPKGRGLTLPFSFDYDSNGVHHLVPIQPGFAGWQSNTGYLSQGGWSYSVPMVNFAFTDVTGGNSPNTFDCSTMSNYMFLDPSGGQHALGLATQFSNEGACPWDGLDVQNFGDAEVAGFLPPTHPYSFNPSATPFEPVTVLTGDGTVYNFPNLSHNQPTSDVSEGLPSSIEDRNGNLITVTDNNNGNFVFKDTAGRSVISSSGFGPSGTTNTLSFSGLSYQITWGTTSASFQPSSNWVGSSQGPESQFDTCNTLVPAVNDTQTVITKITLPNSQSYQFHYGMDNSNPAYQNHFGLLNEIDYPTGAWVKYGWQILTLNELADYPGAVVTACSGDAGGFCTNPVPDGCLFQYTMPVVVTRAVGFGGSSSPTVTQLFSYSTNWGASPPAALSWSTKVTNVTLTDNIIGKSALTKYTYASVPAPKDPFNFSTVPQQVSVEQSVQYNNYDSSLLRTVNKTWYDQYSLASEQTVLENGQTAKTTYCYVGSNCVPSKIFPQLQEKDEFDYGASTPTRKTITNNQTLATPIGGKIIDAPSSIIIQDGSGNRMSETDFLYDQTATATASATQHDDTSYAAGTGVVRANLTTKTQKCFQGSTACTDAVTTYSYDKTGQITSVKDPNLHTTLYSYADSYTVLSAGSNVSFTPANSTDAYLTNITDPLGHTESFTYDYNNGQLTASKDQNSQTTTYIYNDVFSRPTKVSYPDGGQNTVTYNDGSYNPSTNTPSITTTKTINSSINYVSTVAMDGIGHPVRTLLQSDPDGVDTTDTTYDGEGRANTVSNPYRSTSDPTYGTTQYSYDALGRTTLVTEPDGTHSQVASVYSGNCATVTDEASKARKSCTDALGRMTGVWEDPNTLNYETDYSYNALDDLTGVTQMGGSSSGNWRTRAFTYNSLAELLSATNPESGTISYSYDANGNVSSKTAPMPNAGQTGTVITSYSYDPLNRLTQKSYNDGITKTVKYAYDGVAPPSCSPAPPAVTDSNPKGSRTAMCDASGATAWTHDSMGRVLQENRTNNGHTFAINYTYNLDGSLATLKNISGRTITYTPGAAGRSLEAKDTANSINYVTAAHYAPFGALTGLTNGGVITTADSYNNRLQPATLSATTASATVMSLGYDFHLGNGDNGNVFQITNNRDTTRSQTFTYDALNRIASAQSQATSGANCWGNNYTIDPWGNLTNKTVTKCSAETLSAAPATLQNQLPGFQYDLAGNMVVNGSATYTYDAENQIKTAGGVTYLYDGDGKRVNKSLGRLYWYGTGSDSLTETDGSGNLLREFVYFNGKRIARIDLPGGTVHYYFADHLGTLSEMASATGTIENDSDYYPYGGERVIKQNVANEHYKFAGKEWDSESGLDEFGARYYASTVGRFMTPDWAAKPTNVPYAHYGNPQSLNLYSYVQNNPATLGDPDGHELRVADDLQETVTSMRKQSSTFNDELGTYEGSNAGADLEIDFGETPDDPSGAPSSGDTHVPLQVNMDLIHDIHNPDDDGNKFSLPQHPTIKITINNNIKGDKSAVQGTVAHEVGHGHDARKNPNRYGHDSFKTKETKGKTPHDQRPEEKRANEFKDTVLNEMQQYKKDHKHDKK